MTAVTLSSMETSVKARLAETGTVNYTTAAIDEAIRTALNDYTGAVPLVSSTLITLPGNGREIALANLTPAVIGVLQAYWPYDSLLTEQAENQVIGYTLAFDDNQPLLIITSKAEPKTDDQMLLWYSSVQTLNGLDSETLTTFHAHHAQQIAGGAAGYAAMARGLLRTEDFNPALTTDTHHIAWARQQIAVFQSWLRSISNTENSGRFQAAPAWEF